MREILKPEELEYHSYFQKYIDKVNKNPLTQLNDQFDIYVDYIKENAERMDFRYGEGKWTIKESLIHVIDTEQIFAYRALRSCRGDKTPMAGFDQDYFVEHNDFSHISVWDILEEFTTQRRATISMVKKFSEEDLLKKGVASDHDISVRALVYMIAGHAEHHLELFKERY